MKKTSQSGFVRGINPEELAMQVDRITPAPGGMHYFNGLLPAELFAKYSPTVKRLKAGCPDQYNVLLQRFIEAAYDNNGVFYRRISAEAA